MTGTQPGETRLRSAADVSNLQRVADLGKIWQRISQPREFRISCIRPDDLLVCDVVFKNLSLETQGQNAPKLVRTDAAAPAILIVEHPPQSFGEEAFLDATAPEVTDNQPEKEKYPDRPGVEPRNVAGNGEPLPPLPSARIRMAGRSRIAFVMPDGETELAFTIEAVLDACRRWPMRLDVNAVADPPQFGRLRFPLRDGWLASIVASESWVHTVQELESALGGTPMLQKALAGAARRLSVKALESAVAHVNAAEGAQRDAVGEELDVLSGRFAALRNPSRREIAAATLSLKIVQALAGRRLSVSILDLFEKSWFLPIIFAPHQPGPDVTALELPYRLILSPVPQAQWQHRTAPVEHDGRTELWHTRLTGSGNPVGPDSPSNVRALWSPDYKLTNITQIVNAVKPFRMSLDPLDRQMLVNVMSGFDQTDHRKRAYRPRTARAQRLALSSLGALLDVEGNWDPPVGVSLEAWRHIATLGRDHYVRVVYKGFLKEFRHAASLVKVTERKFEYFPGTKHRLAVLRQRFFIVVREPIKHYDGGGHQFEGRNFPFTDIEIVTRVTPSLLAPDDPACLLNDPAIYNAVPHRACFWPMIDSNNPFKFQMIGTDLSGNRVTFAMPLLFVGSEANEKASVVAAILAQSNSAALSARRRAKFGSASICYAPMGKADPDGDPRLPTSEILFRSAAVNGISTEEAQFYPELENATVGIPAIRRLLQQSNAEVSVTYPDCYTKTPGGFGAGNPGEVFLKLLAPSKLAFGEQMKSDAIGGLATPNMAIQGLSRIAGPVAAKPPTNPADTEAALGSVIGGAFNPADFFQGAEILGGVDLGTIVDAATSLTDTKVPKLLSRELPDRVEASFDWDTTINKSDPLGLFVPNDSGASLAMHGVVSAPLAAPTATTFNATASIKAFKVNLFGFVTVWFEQLVFTAKTGAKPDVAVDLNPKEPIAFGGPLEFVNTLKDIIPSNGFSDPPALTVTPSGISASYSLSIPSIAVGIFALEHLSLGAAFLLPFDSKSAEVRFNFAERQRPFSLTVSLLGGGGFFAIGVGTDGVREIEAALEFGAALSINLGVASGSVEVKAGVYFHWQTASVELAGYVRLHGELSVLGLISASLTFNLQLAYMKDDHHSVVWGEATLEVEIDVLFLSFSVSVSCRREFGGSDGDPKFIELIPDQAIWDEYCHAFAVEAAA